VAFNNSVDVASTTGKNELRMTGGEVMATNVSLQALTTGAFPTRENK
jgi:hypothetical protein